MKMRPAAVVYDRKERQSHGMVAQPLSQVSTGLGPLLTTPIVIGPENTWFALSWAELVRFRMQPRRDDLACMPIF
jgi:hypothetical protein